MSTEPPTLQAVLDALRQFHAAFEPSPLILQIPGHDAEQRWQLALDLMIARGVHPGSLNAASSPPSNETLDMIDAWLMDQRKSSFDLGGEVKTYHIQALVDYVRAMKAAQS